MPAGPNEDQSKKESEMKLPVSGWDPKRVRVLILYFLAMLVVLWFWQSTLTRLTVRTIPYSEFKEHLGRGEVVECSVEFDQITGKIELGEESIEERARAPEQLEEGLEETSFVFRVVRIEDPDLVEELQEAGVKFTGVRPNPISTFLLAWALPIVLLVALWMYVGRRMGRAATGMMSIGKSRARFVSDEGTGVDFNDVAGCEEAKFELREVVEFLKEPERFRALGARIPKGVLLVGPPGTGKTLLARAVAGEAKVPFFSISGSDFVEMFVGVGAARVRDLFENAKQQAPCIIFIDELDAIGRTRGVHLGTANDEREQTLNQLLVEMDGFDPNVGVILLSATNRPDVLDRALLRPGRFDRLVVVDAPDAQGREAILKVHARGKPLHEDIDLERIARATAGFSGADLANALNEAALLAARRGGKAIRQKDLEEAIEKVVAGPERKSRRLGEKEKRRVAYHETGHALVAVYSEGADPVHKISIVPRGRAALGYTMQLPTEDQFLLSQSELRDRIRGMLGGRAAEKVVFDEITTGASNDLEQATALAREMVCHYGMSEKIGLTSVAKREEYLMPGQEGLLQRDCSEETARKIDEEVKKILDRAYKEAIEILEAHRDQLETVVAELLKSETLDAKAFYKLIGLAVPEHREEKSPGDVPGS